MALDTQRNETLMAFHQHKRALEDTIRRECDEALRKGTMTTAEAEERMAKGVPVTTTDMANLTTIDVAPVAVNTLWDLSDPRELVLHKLLPIEKARLVAHQWRRITSYGDDGSSGAVPETGRGVTVTPLYDSGTVYNKMYAVEADTTVTANHQTAVVEALGTTDQVEVNRRAAQLAQMRKFNMALYRSRTDTTRDGTSGIDMAGIEQQIEENTNGTVGTASPFSTAFGGNGHIIDGLGEELTFNMIRSAGIVPIIEYRAADVLLAAPDVISGLSASFDGAYRFSQGTGMSPIRFGGTAEGAVIGLRGPGNELMFMPDNNLTSIHYQGKYHTRRPADAPTSVPVVVNASVTSDNTAFQGVTDTVTSKWDTGHQEGAGAVYWVFTEEVDGLESLGTRWPTSGTQAVAAGEQANFQIRTSPNAQRIRVYRSKTDQSSTANTETWHIFDVATDSSGVTVFFDNNLERPDTTRCFGLVIDGPAMDMVKAAGSGMAGLEALRRNQPNLGTSSGRNNGVRIAQLSDTLNQLEMGRIGYSANFPIAYYRIGTALVPDALKCFVFKNIRGATSAAGAIPV